MFNFHTKASLELLLDTSPLSVNLTIDEEKYELCCSKYTL